ncbi:glycosyltransferase family 4 protein [Sphingobacterium sp. N143]|uniref:glycosyltransferase family 4 protein n=1 Tax=Sphingobacterium sp. N143 TaxID=2746727 RepID=UPI0025761332|nr:glycosyltransferase family 4 protein [Sphingobacterium sp. N143]MDM1295931.1 glycosyltransferase family 4 protein [Sphingobacterium sp. N143]
MKILIAISDSFCANFIKGQGNYLSGHGHEVVIVSGSGVEIDELEKNEQVRVIRIPFAREIAPLKDIRDLIRVIKLVKQEKPDIINAGNPKTGFLFSLAHIFFWKIPLIFTLRGVRSDTLRGFKKMIVRSTEWITGALANRIVAISPSLKAHAVEIGIASEKKCIVLSKGSSNGINVQHYTTSDEIEQKARVLREEYKIPKDSFNLVFVGRVTKDKGLVELLEAFKFCLSANAHINLIIAGPIERQDPIPEEYYRMIEEHPRIHYLGKQIDVRPVYALGDALVLYSYREGFGNVVIEAASMGLPTVVADIPGLKDTTEDENTGLLVMPRSAIDLSNAILRLYNDKTTVKKYGENGRKRVVKYFSNEVVWSKQLELYEKILI